jgi:hypothetical protein
MRFHELLELADEVAVAAELEIGVDALLESGEARFLEAASFVLRKGLEREILERGPTPE